MVGVGVVGVAHGSRIVAATDVAIPHDYAVPTDTEHARVCNTHHPRHTQAPVEPPHGCPARLTRTPGVQTAPGRPTSVSFRVADHAEHVTRCMVCMVLVPFWSPRDRDSADELACSPATLGELLSLSHDLACGERRKLKLLHVNILDPSCALRRRERGLQHKLRNRASSSP